MPGPPVSPMLHSSGRRITGRRGRTRERYRLRSRQRACLRRGGHRGRARDPAGPRGDDPVRGVRVQLAARPACGDPGRRRGARTERDPLVVRRGCRRDSRRGHALPGPGLGNDERRLAARGGRGGVDPGCRRSCRRGDRRTAADARDAPRVRGHHPCRRPATLTVRRESPRRPVCARKRRDVRDLVHRVLARRRRERPLLGGGHRPHHGSCDPGGPGAVHLPATGHSPRICGASSPSSAFSTRPRWSCS